MWCGIDMRYISAETDGKAREATIDNDEGLAGGIEQINRFNSLVIQNAMDFKHRRPCLQATAHDDAFVSVQPGEIGFRPFANACIAIGVSPIKDMPGDKV